MQIKTKVRQKPYKLLVTIHLFFGRLIKEQQADWKRHRWKKIKTKLLKRGLEAQRELVRKLPDKTQYWDVTIGIQESINELMVRIS